MVPLLEHYAVTGLLLTGVLLYVVFFAGARSANPLTIILVIAVTIIPVVGVADQALVSKLAVAFAVGIGIGILVSGVLARPFSGCILLQPTSQRRLPQSVRKPQAGRPCGPRWS